jgi:carboxyl-terminal processing protease
MHFLQSDVEDFEPYRHRLDDLTRRNLDTTPAYEIFNRFYERLEQRVAYAEKLLKNEKFEFEADERVVLDRRKLPYPKDLAEAKKLWRERLRYEYLQEKLNKEKPENIVTTLTRRYHRNLRMFADWDSGDVLQTYLTALAQVYDPHSDYMGKPQMDAFAMGMNLALEGIGAELQSPDGYCTIRKLMPGGPAEKSGKIKEKDRIVAVAQGNEPPVDVVDMTLTKVVQLIRGPKGTEVRLTIIPADAADSSVRRVVSLVRDKIKLEDQAAKAKVFDLPGENGEALRLGVLDLPSFYSTMDLGGTEERSDFKSCSADVARLLRKLKEEKVQGLILDLRRNGGGSLDEAIRIAGFFIKSGPVVQVRDSEGRTSVKDDRDARVLYTGPLVVLTSRFSASASEIVAAALQDYGRAVVVGDASTHGKGTVQAPSLLRAFMLASTVVTNDPGMLKYTVSKFYRANGESTQLKGVLPDIILPSVISRSTDVGESALENALPWDTIESAQFDRVNLVEPYREELLNRSKARLAKSKDFEYVREDIQQFEKMQADKSISLNEQQRLKEKEEAEARQKAREKERLARTEPEVKVYELTLSNVDTPGLPAPVAKTNTLASATSSPSAAGGTNSAAVQPTPTADPDDELAAAEDKAPPVDYVLEESKAVLLDYVGLLAKDLALAGGTKPAN